MNGSARLYERAAPAGKANTLLCVTREATFWAGAADYLATHQGGAPVLLGSLYGQFRLRLPGQAWAECRAAFIPPGIPHELDFGGEPFASLYIEPGHGGAAALRPLLRPSASLAGGVLIGASDAIPLLRGFYEDLFSETWIAPALDDLLEFTCRRGLVEAIDPRFAKIMERLNAGAVDCTGVGAFARIADLSPSRFQHLFTQQAGVPFRRYRVWSRLRQAWLRVAQGSTMTQAAHAAGFFDSAHLAREYRRTFGKAASNGIRRTFRVSNTTDWTRDDRGSADGAESEWQRRSRGRRDRP